MTQIKATAKIEREGQEDEVRTMECNYDFGDDVNSMITELGADVVYRATISAVTVSLQSAMRQWMTQGLSDEEINGEGGKLDEWSPPSGKPRAANRMAKLTALMEKLSPQEREQFLSSMDE